MCKIPFLIILLCLFTNCSEDSEDSPQNYTYYYTTDVASLRSGDISGAETFDPRGITIANDKLYICNGNVLEIFDAITFKHITTITDYVKGSTTITLGNLTSVSVDNGRIYVGSQESRLFVFDEATTLGINFVGNGQWWQTFVHVFGVTVKDGLIFVKEKNSSIKVFETTQITDTSNWNLKPIALLNSLKGATEYYSMDVQDGNLIIAGRETKSYLYYDIASIRRNAEKSLTTPIEPQTSPFTNSKPQAISFSGDFAITSENINNTNYLRVYPVKEFKDKVYNAVINASDVMGQGNFGSIVGVAQLNDHLFLSDNTNKKIRILKINSASIIEQQ